MQTSTGRQHERQDDLGSRGRSLEHQTGNAGFRDPGHGAFRSHRKPGPRITTAWPTTPPARNSTGSTRSSSRCQKSCRAAAVVAPVARGASGGLVGADNTLMEVPGQRLTLAYTQGYPDAVNEQFAKLAGSREEFFQETGSIRDFPGSLTLLKRLVFEEMVRPQLLARAAGFRPVRRAHGRAFHRRRLPRRHQAGRQRAQLLDVPHRHARCPQQTRHAQQGQPGRSKRFSSLVPAQPSVCYKSIGTMPAAQAKQSETFHPAAGGSGRTRHLPIAPAHSLDILSGLSRGGWQTGAAGGSRHLDDDRPDGRRGQSAGRRLHPRHHHSGNRGRRTGRHRPLRRRRGFLASEETRPVQGARVRQLLGCRATDQAAERSRRASCCPTSIRPTTAPGPFPQVKGRIINEPAFLGDGSPPIWQATC